VTETLAIPNAEPEAAVYGNTGANRKMRKRATRRTTALAAERIESRHRHISNKLDETHNGRCCNFESPVRPHAIVETQESLEGWKSSSSLD